MISGADPGVFCVFLGLILPCKGNRIESHKQRNNISKLQEADRLKQRGPKAGTWNRESKTAHNAHETRTIKINQETWQKWKPRSRLNTHKSHVGREQTHGITWPRYTERDTESERERLIHEKTRWAERLR